MSRRPAQDVSNPVDAAGAGRLGCRMPTTISHVNFDCHDSYAQARFWCAVFEVVPEGKVVKNRVHLDQCPATTRDEEVARLEGLGATVVGDQRRPDGSGWVMMTDPEDNEFCVERSAAERESGPRAGTVTATGIRSGS